MKNMSELMVDLAYSAVLFNSKAAAEEVITLENEVNAMNYEIKKESLVAARSYEDAEKLTALIEIAEAAGVENEVIFGADIKEIESIRDFYDPTVIYASNPRVKRAVDALINLGIEDENGDLKELHDSLLKGASWHKPDHYYLLNDFMRYQEARIGAFVSAANDKKAFAKKCLINIANAGIFSSDRTISQYAEEIWNISPIKPSKGK